MRTPDNTHTRKLATYMRTPDNTHTRKKKSSTKNEMRVKYSADESMRIHTHPHTQTRYTNNKDNTQRTHADDS